MKQQIIVGVPAGVRLVRTNQLHADREQLEEIRHAINQAIGSEGIGESAEEELRPGDIIIEIASVNLINPRFRHSPPLPREDTGDFRHFNMDE